MDSQIRALQSVLKYLLANFDDSDFSFDKLNAIFAEFDLKEALESASVELNRRLKDSGTVDPKLKISVQEIAGQSTRYYLRFRLGNLTLSPEKVLEMITRDNKEIALVVREVVLLNSLNKVNRSLQKSMQDHELLLQNIDKMLR